jgi:hypothetical protein
MQRDSIPKNLFFNLSIFDQYLLRNDSYQIDSYHLQHHFYSLKSF